MELNEFLEIAASREASDLFVIAGLPLTIKVNGKMEKITDHKVMPYDTERMIREIYQMAHRPYEKFEEMGDDDFSFSISHLGRFRVSTYKQRGSVAAVIRMIAFTLPNPGKLGIPDSILSLAQYKKGLVLVTGPAGSGKSTTLACLIDIINSTREEHIITLEDPLEYIHRHKMSIVSQREISSDTESYQKALRAALRQSPDVILIGELRDYETINIALTAAETGHLVFSSLHTIGAANTIDRIIDVFPANQRRQIAVQLASVLKAAVSQTLVVNKEGTRTPAFDMMTVNPAIKNMIREEKVPQIDAMVYSSVAPDMYSMDYYLSKLYKDGIITKDIAIENAVNPAMIKKKLV